MKSFIAILALAVLAMANPITSTPPKNIGDTDKACGNQVVSCCNASSEESGSGLISAIISPILVNGCLGVSASALNILSPLVDTGAMCGDNEVKCCPGNKNSGLLVIVLQCASL
ncbi:hypothetical protein B0J11DRAFT_580587 [Dendryphion nanum]|uniref:Hydrophobin n=1 Tax=Dendryphion nanum TaxID=256645 RepID=A0A9P9DRQ6_9PLEO|nr:hypothetical protein B0J11DRAFT_580587 [Dendryphion nanum]